MKREWFVLLPLRQPPVIRSATGVVAKKKKAKVHYKHLYFIRPLTIIISLAIMTTCVAPEEEREGRDAVPCGGHSGQPVHGQEAHQGGETNNPAATYILTLH